MGARSGYEAVYEDLTRSPEGQAVKDSLRAWLATARIRGYSFRVFTDPVTAEAGTMTVWEVEIGPRVQRFDDDVYTKFQINVCQLVTQTAAEAVVKANLGVPGRVGTRNCDRDVVVGGGRTGGRKKGPYRRPYLEALGEHVRQDPDLSELRTDAERRIVSEMIATREGPEFGARRRAALVEEARAEARKFVRKYRELSEEEIVSALRDAAVSGVMEW